MRKAEFVQAVNTHRGISLPGAPPLLIPGEIAREALARTLDQILAEDEEVDYVLEIESPLRWLLVLRKDLAIVKAAEERFDGNVNIEFRSLKDVEPTLQTRYTYDPLNKTYSLTYAALLLRGILDKAIEAARNRPPLMIVAFARAILTGKTRATP